MKKQQAKKNNLATAPSSAAAAKEVVCLQNNKDHFFVPRHCLQISRMLSSAVTGHVGDPFIRITLDRIDGPTLELICEYLTLRDGKESAAIEAPIRSNCLADFLVEADEAKFIDTVDQCSRHLLYNLTRAADYLDIPCLLDLCCAKIASLIKGKPRSQLAQILDPGKQQGTHVP